MVAAPTMSPVQEEVSATSETTTPSASTEGAVLVVVLRLGSHPLSTEILESLSILRRNYPVHSVVVVENSDGQADSKVEQPGVDVTIRLTSNRGYAEAMNTAVGSVDTELCSALLFMTDDAAVTAGSLDLLLRPLSGDHIAIAAPAILTDGQLRLGGTWNATFGWSRHIVAQTEGRNSVKTPVWADGACLAVKRSVFNELGGFDERTFLYVEDVQLGVRATQLGHRVGIVPEVVITQRSGMRNRSGAHGYLLMRNEMMSIRATGHSVLPAATVGIVRSGLEIVRAASERNHRIHHLRQALGMAWGVYHGLARRTGPPPRRLAEWANIPAIEHHSVLRA